MRSPGHDETGFSLIEILAVILIVAILAAIAVPVFIRQRERGYEAQTKSALKNAATAIQAYATKKGGSYVGLNGKGDSELVSSGYNPTTEAPVTIAANQNAYCITADHVQLSGDWKYSSAGGRPEPGSCSGPNG